MSGKYVMKLVALLLLMVGMHPAVAAQDAPSESALADLGLPTLDVTVTATGYEGIPDQLDAGRYLVSVTAVEDIEFGGGLGFIQPVGISAEEFLEEISDPSEETGAATPEGSQNAEREHPGDLPASMFESIYAGGVGTLAGETSHVVLDLAPGEWIAWGDDPSAPQQPIVLNVTGTMPTDLPEPQSDATIIMGEYLIEVSEGELNTGSQLVRVDNIGAQPHFIVVFQGPDGMTEGQIDVVLNEEMQAEMAGTTPEWSDLNPDEDLMPITFTGTQSRTTSTWIELDLEVGTYGLVCFFPDMGDGTPHAYHGMYAVVEVGE